VNDSIASKAVNEFRTPAEPGQAQTRVLGSRFLGRALPVSSEENVIPLLEAEKRRYHDATHWCFAFSVCVGSGKLEKSSDAGEPRGTAGLPILREIQKREITDCLVIVTRYFGGTKLGRGNLARAYGECAALTLDATPIMTRKILAVLRLECSFDDQNTVYAVAHRFQARVDPVLAADHAGFTLLFSPELENSLISVLIEESRGRIRVIKNET